MKTIRVYEYPQSTPLDGETILLCVELDQPIPVTVSKPYKKEPKKYSKEYLEFYCPRSKITYNNITYSKFHFIRYSEVQEIATPDTETTKGIL